MDVTPEVEIKDIPIVQNSRTKMFGYIMAYNAMIMLDIIFILAVCGKVIPNIAVWVASGKLLVACLFLGYLKTLKILGK